MAFALGLLILCAPGAAAADPCLSLTASPTSFTIPASGATVSLTVTAPSTCAWALGFLDGWPLATTNNQPNCPNTPGSINQCVGVGNATINLSIGPNTAIPPATLHEIMDIWDTASGTIIPSITFTQPVSTLALSCPANSGSQGVNYVSSLTASAGTPPYNFSYSGSLPPGLNFDASNGRIAGIPTIAGDFSFAGTVTDGSSASAGARCTITIAATCTSNIDGPADVPGLSSYSYAIHLPAGQVASSVTWTIDKPTATTSGPTNTGNIVVQFSNTQADFITLRADFTANGLSQCATKQVALVKVSVGQAIFSNPGKASQEDADRSMMVDPAFPPFAYIPPPQCAGLVVPLPPPGPFWVTSLMPTAANPTPGADWQCFTSNVIPQPTETAVRVISAGSGGPAFLAQTTVTLTSPAQKPGAQANIQIGFIQNAADSGAASYSKNESDVLTRVLNAPGPIPPTPGVTSLDWLASRAGPGRTDVWPWYDIGQSAGCPAGSTATATASGGFSWNRLLCMSDSPTMSIPVRYNPNHRSDPDKNKLLLRAVAVTAFEIRIGVRTLDEDLNANSHYFDQANSTWRLNIHYPLIPGESYVVVGPGWTTPSTPSEINVNLVPASIYGNSPYERWKCASVTCGI
jgi:hypothetical protein